MANETTEITEPVDYTVSDFESLESSIEGSEAEPIEDAEEVVEDDSELEETDVEVEDSDGEEASEEEEEEADSEGDVQAMAKRIKSLEQTLIELEERAQAAEAENRDEVGERDSGFIPEEELDLDVEQIPELDIEEITEEMFDDLMDSPEKFNEVISNRLKQVYNTAVKTSLRALPYIVNNKVKESQAQSPVVALQEAFYLVNEDLDTEDNRVKVVETFNEIVEENKNKGKEESYRQIFRKLADETRKRKGVGQKSKKKRKAPSAKTGSGGGVQRGNTKKKVSSIADEINEMMKL